MATNQLKLYNGALLICGHTRLATLTENVDARYELDAAWDNDAARTCLEAGQWNFGNRLVEIPYTGDVASQFGYSYVFEKPDDLIRIAGVFSDEFCKEPLLDHEFDGDYFYANVDTIYVKFVSDDTQYGMDFAKWPQSFSRFVEAYLADKVVMKVTGGDEKRIVRAAKALKDSKAEALAKDAIASPTKIPPAGTWVSARGGSGRHIDRWPRES